MKIENFQLRMESTYTHETTVLSPFENELQSIDAQRIEAMEDEKQLLSKVKLLLIQEFLQLLQNDGKECSRNSCSEDDLKFSKSNELTNVNKISYDTQKLDVAMQGIIETKNKKISVNINISMSQTVYQSRNIEPKTFTDPLIINLDGDIPQLSNRTFNFDIDNDGESDQISKLKKGNGFLALDRDNNGKIESGNELFGTLLGDGFKELSMFDTDKNFWIDENDSILDKLRIWIKDEEESSLLALGEVGIGAIYLGDTDTNFEYKDEKGDLGRLKSSGLFLRENGQAGVISQIDLAKQEEPPKIPLVSPLVSLLNA